MESKPKLYLVLRAIGSPKFNVAFVNGDDNCICWKKEYKYLGYIISSKLSWEKLMKDTESKVRKRIALTKSFNLFGCFSPSLRKSLFYSYVLPLFTWLHIIYPLFTRR